MAQRISKAIGGTGKKIITQCVSEALVEGLERRMMMSVNAAVLAGPTAIPGNSWTYAVYNTSGGELGTETLTSKGYNTSYPVQPAIEIDITYANASGGVVATGQNFYGYQPEGYVLYEDKTVSIVGSSTDEVYASPYHLIASTSMTANVPVTTPTETSTQTSTTSGGVSTTTATSTFDTITLVSDTPSFSTTVPKGTFNCYQFTSTETDTAPGSQPGGVTQTFVDPTIGLVEIIDSTSITKLTNFTGTSYQLVVSKVPNAAVDDKIGPVQVSLVDSAGNPDTNAADQVTITPSLNSTSTGTGTLTGATPVTTSNGVATFSDLSIDKAGSYSLIFSDSTGRSVPSNTFDISAGKLVIEPIRNGVAGSSLDTFEVKLETSKGKLITDAPSLVTLSINTTDASNPTLLNNTAQQVGGIALFSTVKLGVPGKYTLSATDAQGDTTGISNSFEVSGVHLVIARQPAEAGVNAPIRYIVEVKDARNHLVNTSSIGLGLTLNTVEGGTNALLADTGDTVDFGKATNSGSPPASINSPGEYTLTFTVINETAAGFDYTIDPVTTESFKIVANHLHFAKEPAAVAPGMPLSYEILLEDYRGHRVTTSTTDALQFTLTPRSNETGVLSSTTDTLQNGLATNSVSAISISEPGYYKLTVVDVPPSPSDPVADPVTSGFFKIRTVRK